MKLGIDARLLSQTGVGVYTYNLLYYLPEFLPKDWEVVVFVRSEDRSLVPHSDRYTFITANFKWHTVAEQVGFLAIILQQNLDLMHFTYFSYPMLYTKPFISTIHDLTPVLFKTGKASTRSGFEYYPKYFAMTKVIESSVTKSKAIITPTEFVKSQIVEKYGTSADKVYVTPEGLNLKLCTAPENKVLAKQFHQPFFLYIGNFYPHKNIEKLVEAFHGMKTNARLVLVGPQDHFSGNIARLISSLREDDRIVLYHNASLADLVFFYKNALALVHPSLSEGYGLTPFEALFFGTPVIASNIDVFKETLGNHFIPFDPTSVLSIRTAMEGFLTNKTKTDASKLLKKNTFQGMAKKSFEVYRRAVGM